MDKKMDKKMDKDIFNGMILLGITAILAIVTIVLIIITPFLPDEALTTLIGLISGGFGIFKIFNGLRGDD